MSRVIGRIFSDNGLLQWAWAVAKRKTPEGQVLKAISDFLFFQMKSGHGVWWRVNNGGVWDAAKRVYRKPMGRLQLAGISDIMGVYQDCFYAIEVKSGVGKLTSEQAAFGQMVRENGGEFIVARSVDDVMDIFS